MSSSRDGAGPSGGAPAVPADGAEGVPTRDRSGRAGPSGAAVDAAEGPRIARVFHLEGVVQGVGFRPHVHRLALRHRLAGRVRNRSGEVWVRVEGPAEEVRAFRRALEAEAPPLARIDRIEAEGVRPRADRTFRVDPSESRGTGAGRSASLVPPDVAPCGTCLDEMLDPDDRRHRYPFVTCTDCGPRFAVIEAMPYDRERTTMRAFEQCDPCREEYGDPGRRRYHSETNSCPECGPRAWLEGDDGRVLAPPAGRPDDVLARAGRLLREGGVLAVRGIGGFHLAVDATDEAAVRRLRARKHRLRKPFAVMVPTLAAARGIARTSEDDAALLSSRERPIVLLPKRGEVSARRGGVRGRGARAGVAEDAPHLADAVAPGLGRVGICLPSSPLHRLLLEATDRPLVMTSGNPSGEPIAVGNDEARERLAGIADAYLLHDREIAARCDDSVVRSVAGGTLFLRRSRGYAPLPLPLPVPTPRPLLAAGPHLKNTFVLARAGTAWVSQHVGNLESLGTLRHFHSALERLQDLFGIEPESVVRDLHPGYLSTRIAEESGLPVLAVQHHHAHVAAVAAEHGETGPVVGLAFDGTGHGEDGLAWGAETLVADLRAYRRRGRLRYAPLPGGDLASRRPWRSALGYLSLEPDAAREFAAAFRPVADDELETARRQIDAGLNAPLCSSMGRLFDAAAAVLGLRHVASYEAQAAMELEDLAGDAPGDPLPFPLLPADDGWVMDPVPLLRALGTGALRGRPLSRLAADFHASIAETASELAVRVAGSEGLDTVVLSGGTFQNALLLADVERRLGARGLRTLRPERLGPGDGAVSYGQAAVAAARLDEEGGP